MKVIFNNKGSYRDYDPSVIALGTFDGVHLGHRELINHLIDHKKEYDYKAVVYTFIRHPLFRLSPSKVPPQIMLLTEKIKTFSELGIDKLILNSFNNTFLHQSPEDFIKYLCINYNLKTLVVGYNFRFGYKGSGNVELLSKMAQEMDFKLITVKPVKIDDDVVSSSYIRELIIAGSVKEVSTLLKKPYSISGRIVHGYGRGRDIGFPTANLSIPTQKVLPRAGVYLTRCQIEGNLFWGVTNVGSNPTFSHNSFNIETHVLDYDGNLYGKSLRLFFAERLRDEEKFLNISDLSAQIRQDIHKAKYLIYKFH